MAGKRVISTKLFWFGREIKKKYGSVALKAAEAGGQVILKNLEKNISIPGRATGHPYARHHRTGSKGTEYPWQVHKPGSGLKTFGPTVVARRDRWAQPDHRRLLYRLWDLEDGSAGCRLEVGGGSEKGSEGNG